MGIIHRFLWFVTALFAMAASLAAAAAWLRLLPERLWLNELHYAMARPEALAVLAAFFLLGVHLLFCSFSSSSAKEGKALKEFVLVHGVAGDVKVAVPALADLAERVAGAVPAVRDAKARIESREKDGETSMRVLLRLVVVTGANVADVAQAVTEGIQAQMLQTMSLPSVPVEVSVAEISNAPVEKRRVV